MVLEYFFFHAFISNFDAGHMRVGTGAEVWDVTGVLVGEHRAPDITVSLSLGGVVPQESLLRYLNNM